MPKLLSRVNRRVLIYLGRNDDNVGRVSYKIYIIGAKGRTVRRKYGPVEIHGHRIVPTRLDVINKVFPTKEEAHLFVFAQIDQKLNRGYEYATATQRPAVKLFD